MIFIIYLLLLTFVSINMMRYIHKVKKPQHKYNRTYYSNLIKHNQNNKNVNCQNNVGESSSSMTSDTSETVLNIGSNNESSVNATSHQSKRIANCSMSNDCIDIYDDYNPVSYYRSLTEDGDDTDDVDALNADDYLDVDENIVGKVDQLESFKQDLATVFIKNKISHIQGDSVLRVLRNHHCFQSIPLSTRTLLKTPREALKTLKMEPGEYFHIGFKKELIKKLQKLVEPCPKMVKIDFHVDGMSIHASTGTQFWPIQFLITNIANDKPSIAGIYMGKHKPADAKEYLKYFLDEYLEIQENGLDIQGEKVSVSLRAFIADAPARAFILNHKGHNSFHPCSKCNVTGKSVEKTMTFTNCKSDARTDENYLDATDKNHHNKTGESGLKRIIFRMVSWVPFEYMHLICLGVMKKFVSAVVSKKYGKDISTNKNIRSISERLMIINAFCPSEFARRPRSLSEFHNYKATEFRQLLLYTGPVVFYELIKTEAYNHFLLLHSACRVLLTATPSSMNIMYAKVALEKYVQECPSIYSVKFMTYNIHGLLHVADDCNTFGNLHSFSAFPFEDNMTFFRKYLRKPHQLLQQLYRRLQEADHLESAEDKNQKHRIKPLHQHTDGPMPEGFDDAAIIQYKGLAFEYFQLKCNSQRDSCVLLRNGSIIEVENIIKIPSGHYKLIGVSYLSVSNFYQIPAGIASSYTGIYYCSNLSNTLISINLEDIYAKCFRMPYFKNNELQTGEFVVSALLSFT